MNKEPLIASIHVQQRTEASRYAKHLERLPCQQPSIESGRRQRQMCIRDRRKAVHANGNFGKRNLQQQERRFEIEYENAILLEKMRRITELGTSGSNSGVFYREEPDLRSLNATARRRELERITRENMGIVRRIQVTQAAAA